MVSPMFSLTASVIYLPVMVDDVVTVVATSSGGDFPIILASASTLFCSNWSGCILGCQYGFAFLKRQLHSSQK